MLASGLREVVSLIVFCFGALVAYEGNMAGICIALIAVSMRIEALITKLIDK